MPRDTLAELKPQYLETIELLRGHLKQQLGKTGPVEVNITELKRIAAPWKINRYLRQLMQDGIIDSVEQIPVERFDQEDPGSIVLHCLRTIEEMREYRYSLQGQSGHYIQFCVSSWDILEIRFLDDQEVLITANESGGIERKQLTYGDMGFADKNSGRPNKNWEFLMFLAVNNGMFTPSRHVNMSRNQVSQRKRLLKKALQKVFCLNSDPFNEYRQNYGYQLRFPITYPSTEE